MAKLSKSTKTVIIAAGILLVLGVICLVLVMTTPEEEAPSEVSSVTSIEDTKTDLTVNEADDVLSLTVTNEHGKFTFERKERVVTSTDATVTSDSVFSIEGRITT